MHKLRYGRFFILGFVILFSLQMAFLTYAEKIYFAGGGRYSSKLVDMDRGVKLKSGSRLDLDARELKLSYNGMYMAYTKTGVLYSANLETGKQERIDPGQGDGILFYQWIYDRNRLVIVEREENPEASAPFKLYYYDTASSSKEEIYNGVGDKALTLPGHSKDEVITAMDLSTLTNMMYFKLTQGNGKSRIYQVNIMAQYGRTDTATANIGAMAAMKSTDDFFYENQTTGRVHEENRGKIQVDGKTKLRLLGVDESDRVYLGEEGKDEDRISSVYVLRAAGNKGKKSAGYEMKDRILLAAEVPPEQIHITLTGILCVNDPGAHRVSLYKNNVEAESPSGGLEGSWKKFGEDRVYQGDQVLFYNKGFLSLDHQYQIRNYAFEE